MMRIPRSFTTVVAMVCLVSALGATVANAQDAATDAMARRDVTDHGLPQVPVGTQTRDSLKNGTLVGAAVGFGVGFLGLAAFNAKATDSGPIWSRENVGYYTSAGVVGSGIGALVGALIDAARTAPSRRSAGQRTVAVTPVGHPRFYGVFVSVKY